MKALFVLNNYGLSHFLLVLVFGLLHLVRLVFLAPSCCRLQPLTASSPRTSTSSSLSLSRSLAVAALGRASFSQQHSSL